MSSSFHPNSHILTNKNNSDDFVADPLPFDYGMIPNDTLPNRDILNIAQNMIVTGEHDNDRISRKLPEPRNRFPVTPSSLSQDNHRGSNTSYPYPSIYRPYITHTSMNSNTPPPLFSYSVTDHAATSHPTQNIRAPYSFHHGFYSSNSPLQSHSIIPTSSISISPNSVPGIGTYSSSGHMLKRPVCATPNPTYENYHTTGYREDLIIHMRTDLKPKYWRNGRRNLQCFPSCKVFGDYSYIKMEDLKKHDFMWGKCRGSLLAQVSLTTSFYSMEELLVFCRIHSIESMPIPFEDSVSKEAMKGRILTSSEMDTIRKTWILGERIQGARVQQCVYEFKPKVWKYSDDMIQGKCKRRHVRFYVQMEVFVPYSQPGTEQAYLCIGSGRSDSFEVGSSRVLARQKRKAAVLDSEPVSGTPRPKITSSPLKSCPDESDIVIASSNNSLSGDFSVDKQRLSTLVSMMEQPNVRLDRS